MLPNMKFVPAKSEEQQDILALHRARRRLVNHRTALVRQMRGLLLDRKDLSVAISCHLHSDLPQSACRKNPAFAAP